MDVIPDISVIVPIYNVEQYLSQCIESLIAQENVNIEILLMNDGSTDNSLKICQKYADLDGRIKVYSHDNVGLGETRNRGIRLSTGKYLAFVDSDDYLEVNALSRLYHKAVSNNFDIVQGETIIFDDNNNGELLRCSLEKIRDFNLTDNNIEQFYKNYYFKRIYSHNACDKIYKKSFVEENKIVFGDNKRIFAEDNWFQLQALLHRPSIGFVDTRYYYYRQQENSIMHQPKKNLVMRHGKMMDDYSRLLDKLGAGNVERSVCAIVSSDILTMEALNQLIAKGSYKTFCRAIEDVVCYETLKNSISDLWRKHAWLYEGSVLRKMYLMFIGLLYSYHLYKLAHWIVWQFYKRR